MVVVMDKIINQIKETIISIVVSDSGILFQVLQIYIHR